MNNIEKLNKSISFEDHFNKIINDGLVVYESFILSQEWFFNKCRNTRQIN